MILMIFIFQNDFQARSSSFEFSICLSPKYPLAEFGLSKLWDKNSSMYNNSDKHMNTNNIDKNITNINNHNNIIVKNNNEQQNIFKLKNT